MDAAMEEGEREIKFLQAGLNSLEKYLLSDELYWPFQISTKHGEAPFPALTLSSMLLARARLDAFALEGEDKYARQKIQMEIERLSSRWRVAWERKAIREYHARLKLWGAYLDDYRQSPEDHADRYAYEVGRRVMLELLEVYYQESRAAEKDLLASMDSFLHRALIPGVFIWEDSLMDGFPEDIYWYLYGRLR